MAPNPQQLEVIEAPAGRVMCVAGAGSGKSFCMVKRIVRAVEGGLPPESIVAITFTRKAARELRERLVKELGLDIGNRVQTGTIHSWTSKNIVRQDLSYFGFKKNNVRVIDSYDPLIKSLSAADGLEKKEITKIAYYFSRCVSRGMEVDPEFKDMFEQMRLHQFTSGVMTCDDIIWFAYQRLRDDVAFRKELSAGIKLLVVDECQDSSYCQHEIALYLSQEHGNITVVGDDGQSLYKWRAAEPEHFIGLQNKGFMVKKLETNYRSHQKIITLANEVLKHNDGVQIPKKLVAFNQNPMARKPRLFLFNARDRFTETEWTAAAVSRLLSEGAKPGEIAILSRTVNRGVGRSVQAALLANGIRYNLIGGANLTNNPAIRCLFSAFSLACDTHHLEDWRELINLLRGAGSKTVQRIVESVPDHNEMLDAAGKAIKPQLEELFAIIRRLRAYSRDAGEAVGIFADWYMQFIRDDHEASTKAIRFFDIVEKSADKMNLLDVVEKFTLEADEDDGVKEERVTISTVHGFKGLERSYVFVPDVTEGMIPHSRSKTPEEIQEECRIMYVAVTRAKKDLWLTATLSEKVFLSRFITEDVKKCLEVKELKNGR